MAITITKEPENIYPAYNDSFIEFSSDLADNNKAEITVYPTSIFTKVFVLYPDADGNYLFNLKEVVKVIFNQSGFKDSNFFTTSYSKSITGLYLLQEITIKVYNDITSEFESNAYEFYKAVKQIGENITVNPFQLLSYSPNGIDHALTYFEGFPFHFDLQRVKWAGKEITVKSLNSGNTSDVFLVTAAGAFRINIDRGGGNNWTSDNVLPLMTGLNRLEILENGVFKSNLWLTKKEKCNGIYLKWFNRDGGFSHFLFDKYFIESVTGKDIGTIGNDEFNNIESITGELLSIGKEASRSFILKASYNKDEYEILKDIFTSPFVQVYTSFEAYVEGRFIDVSINGSLSNSNKKTNNEIAINVELPEMITAKL